MGGFGSGDKVGHPFYGNQHGMGRGEKGHGAQTRRLGWITPPKYIASDKTTKYPESRKLVVEFYRGHRRSGGGVLMHEQHQHDTVEHMHLFDENGNIVEDVRGSEIGVSPLDQRDVENSHMIHNHPSGAASLSSGDIAMTMALNGKSISTVTRSGRTWTITRPANGWDDMFKKIIGRPLDTSSAGMKFNDFSDVKWEITKRRDAERAKVEKTPWYGELKSRAARKEITPDEVDMAVIAETGRRVYNDLGFEFEEGEI